MCPHEHRPSWTKRLLYFAIFVFLCADLSSLPLEGGAGAAGVTGVAEDKNYAENEQ